MTIRNGLPLENPKAEVIEDIADYRWYINLSNFCMSTVETIVLFGWVNYQIAKSPEKYDSLGIIFFLLNWICCFWGSCVFCVVSKYHTKLIVTTLVISVATLGVYTYFTSIPFFSLMFGLK